MKVNIYNPYITSSTIFVKYVDAVLRETCEELGISSSAVTLLGERPYSITLYWEYDGYGIWGLTARILNNLLHLIKTYEPA